MTQAREKTCANCKKRPGTVTWGDALAMTHGFAVKWCEVCALEAQIVHAKERAAKLSGMEARLAKLLAAEGSS